MQKVKTNHLQPPPSQWSCQRPVPTSVCKRIDDRLILKPEWCWVVVVKEPIQIKPFLQAHPICGISNSIKKRKIASPPDISGARPWVSNKGGSWWRKIRPRWQQAAAIQLQFWCHHWYNPFNVPSSLITILFDSFCHHCHQCFQKCRVISRCYLPDCPGECLVSLFPSGKSPHLNPTTFLAKKSILGFFY